MLAMRQSSKFSPRSQGPSLKKGMCNRTLRVLTASVSISISDHSSTTSSYSMSIEVDSDERSVGANLCSKVLEAAMRNIREKGSFTLAIPGGSVLKMLGSLKSDPVVSTGVNWKAVNIVYVNHKCVPVDDQASTHLKALGLFLDALEIPKRNVITVTGGADAKAEASTYEKNLRERAKELGLVGESGLPVFDMMVIGMGADGHVGSLYPGKPETVIKATSESDWVLPVIKSEGASSITLSHSLMSSSKQIILCCTGGKKAPAIAQALEMNPPAGQMPAAMIKPTLKGSKVTWLLDAPAAAQLTSMKGLQAIKQ